MLLVVPKKYEDFFERLMEALSEYDEDSVHIGAMILDAKNHRDSSGIYHNCDFFDLLLISEHIRADYTLKLIEQNMEIQLEGGDTDDDFVDDDDAI